MNTIKLLEAAYIYYMYNIFKTKYSIHHPIEYLINNQNMIEFIKHPINSGNYENKICLLGKYVSILLVFWIIFRRPNKIYRKINKLIFGLVLLGSLLMNLNAFIYLIPVFIYELWYTD